jgi:hypothetical protein
MRAGWRGTLLLNRWMGLHRGLVWSPVVPGGGGVGGQGEVFSWGGDKGDLQRRYVKPTSLEAGDWGCRERRGGGRGDSLGVVDGGG